jgi:hypothetical protein
MTQDQARVALQFLARLDLKGGEVPAFIEVARALEVLAQPRPAELSEHMPGRVAGGLRSLDAG